MLGRCLASLFATILPALALGSHAPPSSAECTLAMAADAPGDFREQKIASPWHRRRPAVGALGFEVLMGDWPRLLQRGTLDIFNRQHNREIYDYAAYQDLGQIRTTDAPAQPKLLDNSWCRRTYVVGQGRQAMRITITRLTPAVLCETEAPTLDLFAGEKIGNRTKNDRVMIVPAHAAFAAGGRIRIQDTDEPIPLESLDEPWILFWYGRSSYLRRTTIPNILARLDIPHFIQNGYLEPSDLPVLVVFQHRPTGLAPAESSLRLTFGPGGAGAVAIVPPFGFFHPSAEQTSGWTDALPQRVVNRCRAVAARLRAFPWSVRESYRIHDSGDVTVRQHFEFRDLADDWGSTVQSFAPVPPVVLLARNRGFPVEISGEPAEPVIATHSGPYAAIAGAEAVEWTVRGGNRYIDETLGWPQPPPAAEFLREELRREVQSLVDAGELAPAVNVIGWMEPHFTNPGETVLALAEAIPYLDSPGRAAATRYLGEFMARRDPLSGEGPPLTAGARREAAPPDSVEPIRTVSRPPRWEETANNLYAIWLAAYVTGQWDYVERNAGRIAQRGRAPAAWIDWAACSFFRGPGEDRNTARAHRGEDRGGVWAVNGQLARWTALCRIARRLGDSELEGFARYMLARTMVFRAAHGRLLPYAYDQNLVLVERDADWMSELSTWGGNGGGPGLLWIDHWAGADDDVRAVIQWDEFGPIVAQTLNHFWQPVMPHFQDLTPECGRFLHDHLEDSTRRTIAAVQLNAPAWHLTRRPAYLGKEMHFDSPRNACAVFLAQCYALGVDGPRMARRQDIPFVQTGDLYHLRRLAANLRCWSGWQWETTR